MIEEQNPLLTCRETVFRLEELSRSFNELKVSIQKTDSHEIENLMGSVQIALDRMTLLFKAKAFDED